MSNIVNSVSEIIYSIQDWNYQRKARKEEKIILNMHNNGFTVEQIAMATDKNVEEVKAIIAGKEPALA